MAGITKSLAAMDSILHRNAQGVNRMVDSVGRLYDKLSQMKLSNAFEAMQGAVGRGRTAVESLMERVDQARRETGELGNALKEAVASFSIEEATQAVDAFINRSVGLRRVNDGLQTQEELQERIYQAAQRARGSYSGMVDSVTQLGVAAGGAFQSTGEMVAFAELMNKSFALGGAAPAQADAGVAQLAQAMASGPLQGSNLSELMKHAPMVMQAMANHTGRTEDELMALSSQGFITADLIKASLFASADEINHKFGELPRTFASIRTQLENSLEMALGSVLRGVEQLLNSAPVTRFLSAATAAMGLLGSVISWVMEGLTWMGSAVAENWEKIAPILTILLPAALLGIAATLWSTLMPGLLQAGIMGMLSGLQTAVGWLAAYWPFLLIGAAIGLIIVILQEMGVTFDQVAGFIGGILGGLYAIVYNLVADAWNLIATFAEFFGNVFHDPIGSIVRLFFSINDVIVGILETIANAIDGIFGSNLAGAINGWRNAVHTTLDEQLGEQSFQLNRMEKLDYKGTMDHWSHAGQELGRGVSDTVSSLFGSEGQMLPSIDFQDGMGGMGISEVGKVGEVGKISGDVNIAEEDIKLMKDVAEMRYIQNYVTLTPTVAQNIGTINQNADVGYLLNETTRILADEIAAESEGFYS